MDSFTPPVDSLIHIVDVPTQTHCPTHTHCRFVNTVELSHTHTLVSFTYIVTLFIRINRPQLFTNLDTGQSILKIVKGEVLDQKMNRVPRVKKTLIVDPGPIRKRPSKRQVQVSSSLSSRRSGYLGERHEVYYSRLRDVGGSLLNSGSGSPSSGN